MGEDGVDEVGEVNRIADGFFQKHKKSVKYCIVDLSQRLVF